MQSAMVVCHPMTGDCDGVAITNFIARLSKTFRATTLHLPIHQP